MVVPETIDHHHVKRAIELAITTSVQEMTDGHARRRGDRSDAGEPAVRAKATVMRPSAQHRGGNDGADARQFE